MRRAVALFAVVTMVGTVALTSGSGVGAAPSDKNCGLTTLQGTITVNEDVLAGGDPLGCGPGAKLVVRERLANAEAGRIQRRTPLQTFFTIADVQLADEEAPARAEWSDKCNPPEVGGSGFRPYETMVPHMLNAHIRVANAYRG